MSDTEKKTVANKAEALKGISGDVKLKKAQDVRDASAPVIEADAHVGKNPLPRTLAQLQAEPASLKKVDPAEVHDASAPHVEKDAKIGENPMKAVLNEVPSGGVILAQKKVNKAIDQEGAPSLKPVANQHDSSAPVIDKDVKIKEAPQKAVFNQLKSEEDHHLKHVETGDVKDRSEPAIDPSVKIKENPMKNVLKEVPAGQTIIAHKKINKEVAGGVELKKTETKHDASAPVIEKDVKIGKNPLPEVLAGLPEPSETGETTATLKHPEEIHDASAPAIDPDAKIKPAPQKDVFAEIKKKNEGQ